MAFLGVLQVIGKDFAKGLNWALQYAVPAEKLAALLFPAEAPAIAAVEGATTLIQNAVILVEQKYAASGVQNGTGAQKLAEVLSVAGGAVTQLLASAGITSTPDYVSSVISAVVAILNVQPSAAATK